MGFNRGASELVDIRVGSSSANKILRGSTIAWQRKLAVQYLVIAGGGGGGSGWNNDRGGGAGGAGGYRASVPGEYSGGLSAAEPELLIPQGTYVVQVGAGGAAGAYSDTYAGMGGDSSFDTIVSLGGGYGGNGLYKASGANGGSGGGSCYKNARTNGTPGSGTPGQGTNGSTGTVSYGSGGGGGGAGGAASGQGNGAALSSSITGTSVARAYGGNGDNGGGPGGTNTGSGGGGNDSTSDPGFAGGSGVVIVRYAGSVAKATGGTITYITGYVVHTFTTSGTFIIT